MNRNVVVTGIGILSPVGIGRDLFWEALFRGDTGFREIRLFDTSAFNVHMGGEIADFDPVSFLGKKGLRTLDRSTMLISSAAMLALDDAGLGITDDNAASVGISLGATFGSLHSISRFDREALTEGPRYVNPSLFPNTVINSPASQVSIRSRIRGFNTTVSTGFCASLDAVAYAADFIRLGRVDAALSGGVEELCEETFSGFHALGYLSGFDGSEHLCCPFDARRNGITLSEGAALLVLEDETHALLRKAHILARIMGYGNSFHSERGYGNRGMGLQIALTNALESSHLSRGDIEYIASGANSTIGLDRMETEVYTRVFGEHIRHIPVSSIKSMIGESFSASGAFALAAAVGAVTRELMPPTVNYQTRDPYCDLDIVPNRPREKSLRNVLVVSADPYGNNSAMVIQKYEPEK